MLPDFEALAQRSYVYDADGNEIAVYELENSQPIAYEDISTRRDPGVPRSSRTRSSSATRASTSAACSEPRCRTSHPMHPQQGASTITMQVVKNDFLAGLERDGRYKLLQIQYAKRLEKEMDQRSHHGAVPEHRLLRQQRLRHPGCRRDVLRQDRSRPRRSSKRRSSPASFDRRRDSTRSTNPNAAAPDGSRCSTALVTEEIVTQEEADFPLDGRLRSPRARHGSSPAANTRALVLHRSAARLPAQHVRHPR